MTQSVEADTLVLDQENQRVHQLNEVASFILECCDGTREESRIVDMVVTRFDVTHERAQQDAEAFLQQMRGLGIIE